MSTIGAKTHLFEQTLRVVSTTPKWLLPGERPMLFAYRKRAYDQENQVLQMTTAHHCRGIYILLYIINNKIMRFFLKILAT